MEQFLMQFSTIPHKFVKDFFIIAKEEYTDNEIIINFEIICEWLNVNKSDLKKILIILLKRKRKNNLIVMVQIFMKKF
jgi:hypothetical protein